MALCTRNKDQFLLVTVKKEDRIRVSTNMFFFILIRVDPRKGDDSDLQWCDDSHANDEKKTITAEIPPFPSFLI